MPNLPTTVQIGPIQYSVQQWKLKNACGDTTYAKSRIRISNDLSEGVQAVTLWHEIVHGILFGAGFYAGFHDEHTIDALAHGLVDVLRDNPELREFY